MFRSGAELSKALLASRRPFSSTSVLLAPMPRRLANEAPPVPRPTTWLVPCCDCDTDRFDITCSIVVTPCFFRSSMRMTVTGTAVSASMRLIAEPVISTRWIGAVRRPAPWRRGRQGPGRRRRCLKTSGATSGITRFPSSLLLLVKLFLATAPCWAPRPDLCLCKNPDRRMTSSGDVRCVNIYTAVCTPRSNGKCFGTVRPLTDEAAAAAVAGELPAIARTSVAETTLAARKIGANLLHNMVTRNVTFDDVTSLEWLCATEKAQAGRGEIPEPSAADAQAQKKAARKRRLTGAGADSTWPSTAPPLRPP